MFTRAGVPVAGAMGNMGEARADNTWKPFFATQDIARTLKLATAHGATVHLPAMPIDDLGSQAVIADPAGAVTGIWQPGSFPGFTPIHEHGTPSFIAIDVHDYHGEVAFYRQVFGWDPLEEEADGYHYAGYMDPENNRPIAGIGDEVESLAPGEAPSWSVFWQSDDVDASVAKVSALGGAVLTEAAMQFRHKSTAADLGAWVCFGYESGQGLRPPGGRTWEAARPYPVVTVTGGYDTRVSLAALIAIRPGCRPPAHLPHAPWVPTVSTKTMSGQMAGKSSDAFRFAPAHNAYWSSLRCLCRKD
jgi:uncharacterized protein